MGNKQNISLIEVLRIKPVLIALEQIRTNKFMLVLPPIRTTKQISFKQLNKVQG